MSAALDDAAERFKTDTDRHQMTVLRDDGLYRHLRFARVTPNAKTGKPERSPFYWFDLVTWPGHLTITGDCGTYTFARLEDMFEFFRGGSKYGISVSYWAEKVLGNVRLKTYSPERFRQYVTENIEGDDECPGPEQDWPGLTEAVERDILGPQGMWSIEYEQGAREALDGFRFEGFRFASSWEWDLGDWDWQFLWCCHAIAWGIGQYDAAKVPAETAAVPS